jgi:acetyl esterase/lipase
MAFIRSYKGLFLLLITIYGTACNKPKTVSATTILPVDSAITMPNLAYGSDPLQIMDVYLPNGRSTNATKVAVVIHGGGWIEGDKTDYAMSDLKNFFPGYAIFNLDYRLGNESTLANRFPTQELDVKAAIQFIYDHKANYSISTNWCYFGESAGGHLALLEAYKYTSPIRPKVVIDYYGPTDMVDLYNYNAASAFYQPLLFFLMSGAPADNPALYTSSSPMTYVDVSSPKTIMFHGEMDSVVPYMESVRLHDTLTTLGVVNKLVLYPAQGHGFSGSDAADSYYQADSFLVANMPN